jgi:hypothetical protein
MRPQLEKGYWGAMPAERYGSLGKQIRFSDDRPGMLFNKGETLYCIILHTKNVLTEVAYIGKLFMDQKKKDIVCQLTKRKRQFTATFTLFIQPYMHMQL